jgi:membrane protein DedA with SNARE-associated domain
MDTVLGFLRQFKYVAMFGILLLCGMGLPLPEEVTLIASGLAVGWREADFILASVVCVSAILLGDSFIFYLGRQYGRSLLRSRLMQWLITRKSQAKVRRSFSRHGNKTVFLARFFAGLRIGVYAYAGQHGMSWLKFAFLDLLGALISGPTSIWVGKFAAEQFADSPEEAQAKALRILHTGKLWIYSGLAALAVSLAVYYLWRKRRAAARPAAEVESLEPHLTAQGARENRDKP